MADIPPKRKRLTRAQLQERREDEATAAQAYKEFRGGNYRQARAFLNTVAGEKLKVMVVLGQSKGMFTNSPSYAEEFKGKTPRDILLDTQMRHAEMFLPHFRARWRELADFEPKTKFLRYVPGKDEITLGKTLEYNLDEACRIDSDDQGGLRPFPTKEYSELLEQFYWDYHFAQIEPADIASKIGYDPDFNWDAGKYSSSPFGYTDTNVGRGHIYGAMQQAIAIAATKPYREEATELMKDNYDAVNAKMPDTFFTDFEKSRTLRPNLERAVLLLRAAAHLEEYITVWAGSRSEVYERDKYFGFKGPNDHRPTLKRVGGTLVPQKW